MSSKTAKAGQSVTGSLAHDVISGGRVVIPKGSAVKMTVSAVQASGRLSTPAKLYLRVRTVTVGGKAYTIATSSAGRILGGKGKRDAGFIGGGAAATGKKDIEFPAETKLTFTVRAPVTIN